ncbi:MAG: HD domain-containing protein [bacterium]
MTGSKHYIRKILNDPVHGFISIRHPLIFELIEHPWFQRLRRINQLGLTHLVYPGALHNRLQHSIGAMHLMQIAISELSVKGHEISDEEALGLTAAILLHDIGHGPYSHALEFSLVKNVNHEKMSALFMESLDRQFDGKLRLAIEIFKGNSKKKFLTKLVSSQLDMDRLDYLRRDSFFTGVSEGIINYERLLNMLNVVDDDLVIEAKGIYSVEKFITARRLMYWQVYLHKTVLVAEFMLMKLLQRAKELVMRGEKLFASPALSYFLAHDLKIPDLEGSDEMLQKFSELDDYDILSAMKVWVSHPDRILSALSKGLVHRKLFRIELKNHPFPEDQIEEVRRKVATKYKLNQEETGYCVIHESTSNHAYSTGPERINILHKDGRTEDISRVSDDLNINLLSTPVTKYFLAFPKDLDSQPSDAV